MNPRRTALAEANLELLGFLRRALKVRHGSLAVTNAAMRTRRLLN
jgi:hypothetical protein